MKQKFFFLGIFFSVFSLPSLADDSDNWEFWTRHSVSTVLNEKIEFRISQQFNMNRLMQDMYFHFSEAAVTYNFNRWFSSTMVFREAFKYSGEDWIPELRPYINTTAEIESDKWTLTFRNRMVFRYFRENRNYMRLREKVGLSYDIDLDNLTITPFTSGDLWFAADRRQIEKYQQYAGIWITPMEKLDVGVNYIGNLINLESSWIWIHAWRLSLSVGL
ncbi:MAG: DUF2490 domain-containing protein [Bacteroidales bacterium]